MNETNHTPTPWQYAGGSQAFSLFTDGDDIAYLKTTKLPEDEGNVRFIVRAVNAHDALVAALERMIPVVSKQLAQYVSSEIIQAEAALKLARGDA